MDIKEHTFDLPANLAEQIIELSETMPGIECHNKGGWQGNIDDSYPTWVHELVDSLRQYFKEYTIHGAWFNVNGPGHSNRMHRHYVNSTTGVLYIKVPENSGRVVFKEGKEFLHIDPTPGTILTFPGDIMHEVEQNKSQENRISIAFNLVER